MELKQLIASKPKWTYSDWHLLPPELRCELIENTLYMSPAPTYFHHKYSKQLFRQLDDFVLEHSLGEVIYAPFDIILSEDNVFQPDIIFISNKQMDQLKLQLHGAPAIVIEILSPSTAKYDRTTKKDLYEKFGVQEYWIVDPANALIEVFELADGKFKLHCAGQLKDVVTSKVLQGFELVAESIF